MPSSLDVVELPLLAYETETEGTLFVIMQSLSGLLALVFEVLFQLFDFF